MSTNSLLINYAGYPASPRMLVPDNGLASLAGALIANGHRTVILDFATVDGVRRLFPHACRGRLAAVLGRIMERSHRGSPPDYSDVAAFHTLNAEIEAFQRQAVEGIADEICDRVNAEEIDFVGFKLWTGDGFEGTAAIARRIKERCRVPVFGGGPHVDWFGERILDHCPAFDLLACGDGEEVIVMLAEYVEGRRALDEIPNLVFRHGGACRRTPVRLVGDLASLPLPVYDEEVYPSLAGGQKIRMIHIDESRGCPNDCSFCLHPLKSGKRWKEKRPAAVADEMERALRQYGTALFRFAGSNTPAPLAAGIARELLLRELPVRYVAFANSGSEMTAADFSLLKESGCFGLWFGIESGNERIRTEVMNKREDLARLRSKIAACRDAGMFASGSVVMPSPTETAESRNDTLDFLLETRPDSVIVEPTILIPGTRWSEEGERYGIEIADREGFLQGAMLYKMNLLCPPGLLKPFPYFRINGKTDRDIIREAGSFNERLEKEGILTQVTVDTALLARAAGMEPRKFRDVSRSCFLAGDADGVAALVETVNAAISRVAAYEHSRGVS